MCRYILLLTFLFTACQHNSLASPPRTPSPLIPLARILSENTSNLGTIITTMGYVIVDDTGARLVDELSFSTDTTPEPLSGPEAQLWLDTDIANTFGHLLRQSGHVRYAIVAARGRFFGPGTYGPLGIYHYQMTDVHLEALVPLETSITEILDNSRDYQNHLVRVAGSLLTNVHSVVLVDRLSTGGLPEPGARQLKLHSPLQDTALLKRLQSRANGTVHFGQVQIEGFWHDGQMTPLSIRIVS